MTKPEKFRPVSNLLLGFFVDLMAVLLVAQTVFEGNLHQVVSSVFVAATAVAVSWLLFLRPRLVFNEETLEIVNPLRTIVVGYREISDLNTKYNLTVQVANKKFAIWVAPAPSRYSSRGIGRQDVRGLGIEVAGTIRAADSPNSASGVAAYLVRSKVDAAKASHAANLGGALALGPIGVQVRFNGWGAAAVVAPMTALVISQLLIH